MLRSTAGQSVDIIIPAHNEAPTLASIVGTAARFQNGADRPTGEVIVVADHCLDESANIARGSGATRVIEMSDDVPSKTLATLAGALASQATSLFFLDADCRGLKLEHLLAMDSAHRESGASMTVGSFDYGPSRSWAVRNFPWSTGQRIISRDLFIEAAARSEGYGIEMAMNTQVGFSGGITLSLTLNDCVQRTKMQKFGSWEGWKRNVKMWHEIASTFDRDQIEAYQRYMERVIPVQQDSWNVALKSKQISPLLSRAGFGALRLALAIT